MTPFMTTTALIIISIVVATLAIVGVILWTRRDSSQTSQDIVRQVIEAQKQDQSMQFLQREVANLRDQMAKSITDSAKLMTESQKTVGERLDKAAEVVGNVQRALGALDKAERYYNEAIALGGEDVAVTKALEELRARSKKGRSGLFGRAS